jgi:hypothetical protein
MRAKCQLGAYGQVLAQHTLHSRMVVDGVATHVTPQVNLQVPATTRTHLRGEVGKSTTCITYLIICLDKLEVGAAVDCLPDLVASEP